MTDKEKAAFNAVMAVWRGIPARDIAHALSKVRRGVNFSGCTKADMADAVANTRYGDYGSAHDIAAVARKAYEDTLKHSADRRSFEARQREAQDRRDLLTTMTSAQLDGVFKALEDQDIEAEGSKVTLTKDWYNCRTVAEAELKRELTRIEKLFKVRLIMSLEERMRAAKATPATKEKA